MFPPKNIFATYTKLKPFSKPFLCMQSPIQGFLEATFGFKGPVFAVSRTQLSEMVATSHQIPKKVQKKTHNSDAQVEINRFFVFLTHLNLQFGSKLWIEANKFNISAALEEEKRTKSGNHELEIKKKDQLVILNLALVFLGLGIQDRGVG